MDDYNSLRISKLIDFVFEDIDAMRNGDCNAKERLIPEVMALNAITNALDMLNKEYADSLSQKGD